MSEPGHLHELGSTDALGRVHDQHPLQAGLGFGRDGGPLMPCHGELALAYFGQDGLIAVAAEWCIAAQQNIHNHACCPDIHPAVMAGRSQYLHSDLMA